MAQSSKRSSLQPPHRKRGLGSGRRYSGRGLEEGGPEGAVRAGLRPTLLHGLLPQPPQPRPKPPVPIYQEPDEPIAFYAMGRGSPREAASNIYAELEVEEPSGGEGRPGSRGHPVLRKCRSRPVSGSQVGGGAGRSWLPGLPEG